MKITCNKDHWSIKYVKLTSIWIKDAYKQLYTHINSYIQLHTCHYNQLKSFLQVIQKLYSNTNITFSNTWYLTAVTWCLTKTSSWNCSPANTRYRHLRLLVAHKTQTNWYADQRQQRQKSSTRNLSRCQNGRLFANKDISIMVLLFAVDNRQVIENWRGKIRISTQNDEQTVVCLHSGGMHLHFSSRRS